MTEYDDEKYIAELNNEGYRFGALAYVAFFASLFLIYAILYLLAIIIL